MHRNCIQRKIRRADREGLSYEVGRSSELLDAFYELDRSSSRRRLGNITSAAKLGSEFLSKCLC